MYKIIANNIANLIIALIDKDILFKYLNWNDVNTSNTGCINNRIYIKYFFILSPNKIIWYLGN